MTNLTNQQRLRLRDGDNCFLCAQPIDFDLTWPQGSKPPSNSSVIGHRMPQNLGGSSDLENRALCHLLCNQRRNSLSTSADFSLSPSHYRRLRQAFKRYRDGSIGGDILANEVEQFLRDVHPLKGQRHNGVLSD